MSSNSPRSSDSGTQASSILWSCHHMVLGLSWHPLVGSMGDKVWERYIGHMTTLAVLLAGTSILVTVNQNSEFPFFLLIMMIRSRVILRIKLDIHVQTEQILETQLATFGIVSH